MEPVELALVLGLVAGIPFGMAILLHRLSRGSPVSNPDDFFEISDVINGHANVPRHGWKVVTTTHGGRRLVEAWQPQMGAYYWRLAGAPPQVTLRTQDGVDAVLDSPAYQEKLGDPWLDERLLVRGDLNRIRPLLTQARRSELVDLLAGPFLVTGGEVIAYSFLKQGAPPTREAVLARMEAILAALSLPPGGPAERLLEMARTDPVPALRVDALRQMHREQAPGAEAVFRELCADRDDLVAVHAALLLGAGARDTVHARLAATHPPGVWREALDGAERAPVDSVRALLHRGLIHQDLEIVERCVEVLAAIGGREDVEALRAVPRGARREAERAIASIQGRLGDAEAGRVSVVSEDRRGAVSEPSVPSGAVSEVAPDASAARPPPPRVTR